MTDPIQDDVVEQVAKAILHATYRGPPATPEQLWEATGLWPHEDARKRARAALAALRTVPSIAPEPFAYSIQKNGTGYIATAKGWIEDDARQVRACGYTVTPLYPPASPDN